jgi:hypothetical protein
VIFGLGGHVVKCGLGPAIIELVQQGVVTAVAMNGGAAIHDCEVALYGETSEDVEPGLSDGSYGMVSETVEFVRAALEEDSGDGLGRRLGRQLSKRHAPHARHSILHVAYCAGIPASVHVAVGTDTIHMAPRIDPARLGEQSHHDFRLFAAAVSELQGGGVYLNVGSAVLLPEVFLKAITLCRNLGYPVERYTTVDLDMVRNYRPTTNVVERHRALGARGFALTGHHEIMLPLLSFAVMDRLESARVRSVA